MKNLYRLLANAMTILDELNIPYGTIDECVTFSKRRYWGVCSKVAGKTNTYKISINDELLQDDVTYESTMNTLVHELLHAYPGRMCHTGEWKRCANIVNEHYPKFQISRCTSSYAKGIEHHEYSRRKAQVHYLVRCNGCGRIHTYARKGAVVQLIMKYPNNHGCRCSCGSRNLILEQL